MKNLGLGAKIMLLMTTIVVLTSASLVYFEYHSAFKELEDRIGRRLEAIARSGALMIDGDMHDKIPADKTGSDRPEFKAIQKVIRKLKKANKLSEAIYTFRRDKDFKNKVRFIVMTQKKAYTGHDYKIKAAMFPALDKGVSTRSKIFKSENGWWISAHAPFFNSKGKVAGILNIDIKLQTFQEQLRAKTISLLGVSGVILLLGLIFGFVFSKSLVKRLHYLRDVTEKISLGQMDHPIQIDSNDELGKLANSLERMRESLKVAMELLDDDDDDDDDF